MFLSKEEFYLKNVLSKKEFYLKFYLSKNVVQFFCLNQEKNRLKNPSKCLV